MTEMPHMIVFPKNHRLAKTWKLALADLDEEALIVPPQRGCVWRSKRRVGK